MADDLRASVRVLGEGAGIENQVDRGAGDDGRECLHALDGLEAQMRGAIAPHRRECDEDASVGAKLDAMLGEGRAEEGAAALVEASAIVRGHPDMGVEIEAVELGLAGAAGGDVTEVRRVADAADADASAGAASDTTLDGGTDEAGLDGRGLGERVGRRRVAGGLQLAAGKEPTEAHVDGGEDLRHVLIAGWGVRSPFKSKMRD